MKYFIAIMVACFAGSTFACDKAFKLGSCVNPSKANDLGELNRCASKGDIEAYLRLSEGYAQGVNDGAPDLDKSVFYLAKAADKNCASAQRELGYRYYGGRSVSPSVAKAVKWWKLAAAQNDAEAMCALGTVYSNGEDGNPVKPKEAFNLIKEAVELGASQCMVNLAFLYNQGVGTKVDTAKAKETIKQAVKLGVPRAVQAQSEIESHKN